MKADKLSSGVQEHIVALQAFDEDKASSAILALVKPKSLDPYFREIAEGIQDFRRDYKKPPKQHLSEIVEAIAERKPDEAEQYWDLYRSIIRTWKEGITKPAVLDAAKYFVRAQQMRLDMAKALDLLETGTKQAVVEADNILRNRPTDIDVFDLGLKFNDPKQATRWLTNPQDEVFPTGIPELDKWEAGPMRGGLWDFMAPTGRGKSLSLNSRVWLPSVGYRTMRECVANPKGLVVYGVHRRIWRPTPTRVMKVMPSGKKPVCKITLRSGRIVNGLSDTHPILTWNGYVPTKDLKVGDFTVGSSYLPLEGVSSEEERKEAYVVGAFLGDGALTAKELRLCVSKEKMEVLNFVNEQLDAKPRIYVKNESVEAHYYEDQRVFLEDWGVENRLSKERFVPRSIYAKGPEVVAACLAGLFDTDGSAYFTRGDLHVEFSTASYALSEDYLTMFNVLGIYVSRRKKIVKLNGKRFEAWIIQFRDAESLSIFKDRVGRYGQHSLKWGKLENIKETKNPLTRGQFYRRIPYLAWVRIVEAMKGSTRWTEKSTAGAFRAAGVLNPRQASEILKQSIRRKTRGDAVNVAAMAAYIEDDWLQRVSCGKFVFDEVVKIEWLEEEECWDFCTEDDTQSFLAEHVFTHNTWAALHMSKVLNRFGKKVAYITLEMSEDKIAARLIQSMLSMTKRKQEVKVSRLHKDKAGKFIGVGEKTMFRPFLQNEKAYSLIEKRLNPLRRRPGIFIKRFPTGKLTVPMLNAYLDQLEHIERFIPDAFVIDYPKLMDKGDPKYVRQTLGKISEDLRGIAVERNMAAIILSQSNRAGYKAGLVDLEHQGEESITNETSDTIITYNQTKAEKARNLARLYVAKSRGDLAQFQVLISQAYAMGQFALDSIMLSSATHYEKMLNGDENDEDDVE
jgi:intein/homing endonuclease